MSSPRSKTKRYATRFNDIISKVQKEAGEKRGTRISATQFTEELVNKDFENFIRRFCFGK